jgi:hypothetical protein
MVVLIAISVAPHELRPTPRALALAERPVAAPGSRDIWFLVFDRYGNDRAMLHAAEVANDLPSWLEERGFFVARDARANYGRTVLSLAATLGLSYLDELAARLGPGSGDAVPLTDLVHDHQVGRFLQARGYRYVHIGSWFGPTSSNPIADENPILPDHSDFGDNVLRGASIVPLIDSLRGSQDMPTHDALHRAGALFGWSELDRAAAAPGPKFVFGHVLLPHEPYVFNADGSYPALSAAAAKYSPEAHAQQLAYTNARIRDLVTRLLAVAPGEEPIIIVAADEGPYPDRYAFDPEGFDWATATDEDLETKYGVLQAMYLPGDPPAGAPDPYPDMTLINTFPIVLDRYFGQDIPLFEDRSFTSRSWSRPYDLADITDRLDGITP